MLPDRSQPAQSGFKLLPFRAPRLTPLALWHLLSLDAPTVAALWTVFIAGSVHLHLPRSSPAAMFLAVWMIYAADRLLDSRDPSAAQLELRHHFHHRHRVAFLSAISVVATGLVWLILRLDPAALRLYVLLATLLGAWLLLVHARPTDATSHRLPKELAVGVVFSAAVFIPTVARAPQLRQALLPAALVFGLVCTLNCLFIYTWEHPAPRLQAHWTTRWATHHLVALALGIVGLAMAGLARSVPRAPLLACIASILLLLVLHRLRGHMRATHLRAAADLALLTPLLFLPLL